MTSSVHRTVCFDPFPFPVCGEAEKDRIRALAEELDAHRKRVQAQHPGLTLTGMYNVLEKLRTYVVHASACSPGATPPQAPQSTLKREQQTLTDKERLIHDQGLVSLLQQLHDDLDAAVFAAYGWPTTLTDAEILERLVHLNAQRAAEEKRGIIHWLRPEYQSVGQRAKGEESPELPLKPKKPAKAKSGSKPSALRSTPAKQPWPKTLADRIRAVEAALHGAGAPVTAADLSKHFTSTKPAALQEILESLAALGRARVDGERFAV